MDDRKFRHFISEPRFERYLLSCNYSQERALKLYKANILVAQSFYPILNLFETFLRNSINNKLTNYFNDDSWIINQKYEFMSDNSLGPVFWLKQQVNNAERNLVGSLTPGKIISEQPLGFWTCLFEPKHYRLLHGNIIQCFPFRPSFANRAVLATYLKEIREFRNRVYHNESICFRNTVINFTQVEYISEKIYNLLYWMDPELVNFVEEYDNSRSQISFAMSI
ncbi:MAG: hypothetical protein K0S32_3299 [Bacteroidetes bacterium]|jgi:hypothetical protein|nr:hypothetical protein [Bacteroidota bacterium]